MVNSSPDRKKQTDKVQSSSANPTTLNSPTHAFQQIPKKDISFVSPHKLLINIGRGSNPKQYQIGQDVEFEKATKGESIPGNKNSVTFANKMPNQPQMYVYNKSHAQDISRKQ